LVEGDPTLVGFPALIFDVDRPELSTLAGCAGLSYRL